MNWWLAFIKEYVPRPIPTSLHDLDLVVSYSDGEGAWAGIGAAMWAPWLAKPLAVYTEVPEMVRRFWLNGIGEDGTFRDIFFVEALGPLILLMAFPKHLRNVLWIHFIDNEAAESSLIRGSSSVAHGDYIAGITWATIQRRGLWAYFDRVESKANPTDGISGRDFDGPWDQVHTVEFPLGLLKKFWTKNGVPLAEPLP